MEPWVEATVGIWLFERLWRICSAVVSVVDFRIFVRKPVVKARASIVDGAIKLTVPCKGQAWTAGQHFYVSFWCVSLFCVPLLKMRGSNPRRLCHHDKNF